MKTHKAIIIMYSLPFDLISETACTDLSDGIHIVSYQAFKSAEKVKVTLHYNLFNFLMEGEKGVSYAQKQAQIDASQFLLLSSGNCLMTEKKISDNGAYKTTLLFFDNKSLTDFFLKYPNALDETTYKEYSEEPFLIFQKDDFVKNFIASLHLVQAADKKIAADMARLKFEELMLYMVGKYPEKVQLLRSSLQKSQEEFELRKAVETHLESNLTIEELSFLCHMSVSTFKRHFTKMYGTSPNKWMLQRRMEIAASLLQNASIKPSDVYYRVGYENLSSFIQSFKQAFGMTPKEYQMQKMNVHL